MKLKILGTQSPYNTEGHNCPGFLITDKESRIMIDCGSGSHSLLSYPSDLNNMSIIMSHLHRDHYNDIYNMQYSSFVFHNQKRIKNPINIYLPKTPNAIHKDIVDEESSFANYHTIDEAKDLNIGSMVVSFCKTDHPVETYAIKVSNGEKTIVYTSDTSFSAKERLVKFFKNADLLISESSLLKEHGFPEINSHLTAAQAATIAKESNVKGLILTHFWPEEQTEKYVQEAKPIFKKVVAAKEGMTIELSPAKENRDENEMINELE